VVVGEHHENARILHVVHDRVVLQAATGVQVRRHQDLLTALAPLAHHDQALEDLLAVALAVLEIASKVRPTAIGGT